MQPAASGQNRGVDRFMHAAAVPVVRPVRKQPDHVIGGEARSIRPTIVPFQKVSRVFVVPHKPFDHGQACPIQDLVRVEHQNPPAARARKGAIAGSCKIDDREIERDHRRAETGRDQWRGVRRTSVHHDQLTGEIPH